jgi:hypothetical protein
MAWALLLGSEAEDLGSLARILLDSMLRKLDKKYEIYPSGKPFETW